MSAAVAQEPLITIDAPVGSVGFGNRVAALGDVNSDGVLDAAIADQNGTVFVMSGSDWTVLRTFSFSPWIVSGLAALDADGDGVRELIVAYQTSVANATCRIDAFDVGSGVRLWTFEDFQFVGDDEVRFDIAQDFDGDGIEDLMVGFPDQDFWHPAWWLSSGKVLSGQTGFSLMEVIQDPSGFGEGVAAVGDVNQDGRTDVVFGSRSAVISGQGLQPDRGSVILYERSAPAFLLTEFWHVDGSHALAEFGEDVVAVGDRDGDGYVDLVALETLPVGGPGLSSTLRLQAMSGFDGAFLNWRDFPGEAYPGTLNEVELEPVDDADGDGVKDFVMVVPISGVHGQPEVRVLSGATLATLHAWSVTLQESSGDMGATTVALLGDWSQDGAPDLLVGRPDDSGGGGRVLVLPTLPSVGVPTCATAVVNSTGRFADLRLGGSLSVVANELVLIGHDIPASAWVLPITGTNAALVPMAGGSTGTLCLGGEVRRLGVYVARADAGGAFVSTVDLTTWHPVAPLSMAAGETWHFQLWFRDSGPTGATSNFSDALEATFQ